MECAGVLNSILSGTPSLELLSLSGSLMHDLIARVLFDGLKVPKLKWLELSYNRFDTYSLTALNYVIKNTKLD